MSNSETIPNVQSSSQTTEQSLNQIPNVKLSNSDKILIPESKTSTYAEL